MKKLYFALLVLLSVFTANSVFGQSISINYFDSAAKYAPGSGVSVQLNITGAFDRLNNQFILQLSDSNGNFTVADTKNLTFVQDFYTPNISGVIPSGLPAGTGYRLRVVSTLPTLTSVVSNPFEIVATPNSGVPAISFPGQTFNINCLDKNFFGFLNNSTSAKTATIYSSITDYDDTNYTYSITLFSFYPTFQSQNLIDDIGAFNIPSDLPVGNYSIEIKRTHKTTSVTSVNTYNFLFNTGNTSLGNTSSENICTTNTFNINVDLDNIRTNYPGSFYTFDFGDGTPVIYRTHAELMANPTLQHQYNIATCDASASLNNGGYYQVSTFLYNKGIGTINNTNPNLCSVFSQNGNGKSAKVRVSTQPIANFNGPISICKSSGATFINTTLGGKWSANGVSCNTSFNVIWLWKRPGSADFTLIPTSFYANTNKDLVIPSGILTTAGIMYIKLQANNPDGCIDATEKTMAVCIENPAVPSFDFVYGLQTLPNNSTLCINTTPAPTVILKNKSNTLVPPSPCSSATYLWTITPSTGATLSNPTAVDPTLTFSIAGTYNVRLRVTNSCGAVDTTKTITVVGPPSISNYSGSVSYCDTIPKQLDFAPTYNANFAKAADLTYTWTVTGTGITNADYEFTGGTTASSANPKIIFKKYGTYAVKVVFTNGCGSAEATKTFIFNQPLQASITANTSATDITVCPSTPINLNALINGPPGYTYVWTKTGGSGSLSANNVLNPVYTPSLADNGQQITFTLTVTYPGTVPSPCTSPLIKTIKVTYVANNTAANTTLARCSGTAVGFTPVSTVTGSQFTWTIKSIGPNITGANASAIFGPGPINDVLVNTGTAIETVVYEISAKSAGGCVGTPFTLTVTVYPPITGNVISANQTICANQTPAALGQDASSTLSGGNLTTYIYAWEQKVGAGPWTIISGASSATFQPGALTNTTLYRRTVWSPNAQSCVNVSSEITVTVNPLPSVTLGAVTAICNSEISFLLPYSAAQNTPTKYSISVSTPAMPGFIPVVDADLGTSPLSISIPSGLAQNNYVFVFTVKNANGCVSSSQTFTVPVKSPPTPAIAGSVDTLINCNNGSFTMSANLPTIGAGIWSIVGAANGATITSPTSRTTTITGLQAGTSVRLRWTISNAPCADSFDDIVLINEAPTTVALAGATLRNCDSGTFTLGANTPAANEQGTWTIVGAANGAIITNSNSPNSTLTGLQAGKSVTLRWTITNKACSSSATTTVSNVNPITANTISFSNPDPCTGQQITIVGSTPVGGDVATLFPSNFNYSWEIKNSLGGWDPLPNTTKDLSNYTTSTTFTVRRKVTSYECTSTSNELTITVLPLASNTISAPQTICFNTVPAELTGNMPSGGSGSYTFQWQSSSDNITFTNIASAQNQNYQPLALTSTTYFRRLVSSGTCLINSTSVKITVNPKPVMTTITDKTFCNNASVSPISFASNPGTNTTYAWTNDNTAIGLGASGSGATPLFTSSNLLKEPIFGTIVITPTYTVATSTGAFCEGTPTSFKLYVLPTISANPIADTTVCTGSTISAFIPSTDATAFSGSSVTFKWTVAGSGINLLSNSLPQNQVSAFTATNSGTSDLQATITVTPVYNFILNGVTTACDGIPTSYKITVKPNPSVAVAGADAKICGVTEYTLAATSPIVGTGVWTQTLGPAANFTNPNQYNTKVTGLQAGTRYEFQWTVTNAPCASPTNDKVIVDVLSPITNTIKADKLTICVGESVVLSSDVLSGGNVPGPVSASYSYIWETSPNGANNWQVLTGSVSASLTLSPTSNIYVRRKVSSYNLCEETSQAIAITVNPGTPTANAGSDQILCNLTSATLAATNNLGSTFAGRGKWTDVTVGGTVPALIFSDDTDPSAVVSGLQPNKTYTLRWTIAGLAPCAPTSDEVSITVRPEIVANAGLSKIFCDQSNTNKSYTLAANTPKAFETGLWTVLSGPAGSSFSAATSPTSSINNLSPGTYILKWTVQNDANTCAAVSDTMKLEVFAAPISGALTSSINQVCDTGNSGTITLSGHVGTIKQWEYKEVGGAWTILANTTTTQSFINLLKTTYYRALVVSDGPSTVCPSNKYTDSIKIQVDPASVGGTTAGADTVCQGSNSGTITLSGQVGTVIRWEKSTDGINWTAISSNLTSQTYLNLTQTTRYRAVVISGVCSEVYSFITTITVNPITPTAIAGSDQILCNLTSATLAAVNNLGTNFSGTWTITSQPVGSTATFSDATSPSSTILGLIPGDYVLKWTIAGLAPCAPTSDEVSITVRPEIVANAGLSKIFCDQSNTNKSYTLAANTPKAFETGLWTVVSGPAGSSFSAATSPTSSINNLSPGTYILKWTVQNDANTCAAVSDTMKLEVFAAPISGALTSSINQVCDTGNSGTITLSGHVGTIKQWEYKEVGGAWTILANTTTTQSFINLLKTTYYRALVVSDGPSTVCPSNKYTDSIKIQVDPASVGGTTAGADTVCQGSNSGTITLSGKVGTVVEWQYSTNNGTSWTAIANTTATLTYTGLTTPLNTITQYQYRARVKSGVCSEQFSSITTIAVLPPVTTATASNLSECNVTTTQLTGNLAIQGIGTWTQLPGGPSVAVISDIHNPTSVVSNLVVGVYTFKWTIDNGFCAPSSATMTLSNYPAIVNEIQTAVDTICADQAILISDKTHTGGTGTYTYKWQSSANGTTWNDILPAQTGLTLAINLSTSTYFRRIISSGPCSSVSDSIYIFVQPALANNTITAISEVCINKPVALIVGSNPTGGDGVFSYQWQSKVGAGAWTNISGATGKDYQPLPLLQTTSFRRILTTALCNGPQQSVSVANEIIVRLNAKAEFSASKLVNCSPFNLRSVITLTPYPDLNSTYKWYADGVLIGTGTTFPAYTIANDGVTVDIKLVTLSKFGCDSAEKVISFQTIKHVTAAFTKSVALGCGPLTVSFTNTSTPAGPGPQYQWNFGNGQTSTLANPPAITFQPHPLNRDTTYVIRLRAYTDCQESIFIDSVLVRPKPVSIFSPDKTEGCAPVVVNFTNQSKGHPATYKFIFGDGDTYTTTTLETVQHIYQDVLVNTLYTAKLIVTNECGVDSSSYVIKVKPNTVVANLVVNGPEKQGCPPHTVTFFNNSTGANQFIWNFGDGTPIITNAARTMVHTFVAGGTYQVKLTATNGCSVRETTETIVVYPEPISSYTTAKNTYCKDEWINFVNTSPQGDFVWTFGDGVSSTQTNPQHRFVTPGTYLVTLTTFVTQPDGTRCSKSVSKSFTVLNPPIATFSSNASAFNCAPFQLMVSNTSQFANKYSWYVDGVLVSTQATPLNLWLYASNRAVTVRLVAENTAGCASASVEQTIQMYPRPEANFVVLPSQIIKIPNYTFSFQNTTLGAVTSYKWTFGDGSTSTATNPTHTYKMIGQYQVNLIAFNQEGCSDTLSRQVEVQTVPGYLFVPNAFEPGSQTYELKTFKPKGSGIESYHLKIFNKWGYLVWETTAIDSNGSPVEGWDGMMNGVPAPPDVYVWTIDAKFINQTVWPGMRYKSSDKPKTVGSIHLIK